jgi:hypothetical protein
LGSQDNAIPIMSPKRWEKDIWKELGHNISASLQWLISYVLNIILNSWCLFTYMYHVCVCQFWSFSRGRPYPSFEWPLAKNKIKYVNIRCPFVGMVDLLWMEIVWFEKCYCCAYVVTTLGKALSIFSLLLQKD